jgi:hypothetical protein
MRNVFASLLLGCALAACARPAEEKPVPAVAADEATADVAPPPAALPPPAMEPPAMTANDATPAPGANTWVPGTPADVVQRFVDLHARHSGNGAPDAAELATYAPLLTRGLRDALARAHAQTERDQREHPDDKPAYVEGALFASLFEGYERGAPVTIAVEGDRAQVPVRFVHAEKGEAVRWTDTFVVVREDGTWRIDDVVYGGDWDFANHGRLRDHLPKAD